jgi:hypothetical protein
MADIDPALQTEIIVTSEIDGGEYHLRIPSAMDQAKFGFAMRKMRQRLDPDGNPSAEGLDPYTHRLVEGMATFELFMKAAPEWVYKEKPGPESLPVVDATAFKDDSKLDVVIEVSGKFWTEVARFRQERTAAKPATT